jgi:D-sedoheptulose 7-phosphate isomerase
MDRTKTFEVLEECSALKLRMKECVRDVEHVVKFICEALRSGGRVLLCGNGGSAADAQHIAAELVGRFKLERSAFAAVALTTDTSILTALGNDYGYSTVFSRQVEALCNEGDVLIGISTSGNSPNVLEAVRVARERGAKTVGLTGENGGKLKDLVDACIRIPSSDTPRIQEGHITIGHIICELVETELASTKS